MSSSDKVLSYPDSVRCSECDRRDKKQYETTKLDVNLQSVPPPVNNRSLSSFIMYSSLVRALFSQAFKFIQLLWNKYTHVVQIYIYT